MSKKQEVATVDAGLPAYLKDYKGPVRALEGLDQTDYALPRIVLLQSTSSLIGTVEGAVPGVFWHNVMDQSLGKEFEFIIARNRKKYLLMAPIGDERGVLARAEDGVHWVPANASFEVKLKGVKDPVIWTTKPTVRESGLAEFGSSNPEDPDSVPAATLFYEYLVYLPEHPELSPVLMSLARSQIRKAKRELHGKITMHTNNGRPLTSQKYRASVVKEEGKEGSYFNYSFAGAGFATNEEFRAAEAIAEAFSEYRAIDEEAMANEARQPEGSPATSDEY